MSSDTLRLVVVGALGLVVYSRLRAQATQAATQKRVTATERGAAGDLSSILRSSAGQNLLGSAVGGLSKWLGTAGKVNIDRSTAANLGGSTSLTSGYFTPSPLAGYGLDWGIGGTYGDDSTTGAVVDPADFAYMDQVP